MVETFLYSATKETVGASAGSGSAMDHSCSTSGTAYEGNDGYSSLLIMISSAGGLSTGSVTSLSASVVFTSVLTVGKCPRKLILVFYPQAAWIAALVLCMDHTPMPGLPHL